MSKVKNPEISPDSEGRQFDRPHSADGKAPLNSLLKSRAKSNK